MEHISGMFTSAMGYYSPWLSNRPIFAMMHQARFSRHFAVNILYTNELSNHLYVMGRDRFDNGYPYAYWYR